MPRLIVYLDNGNVDGVYTDSAEDIEVKVCESDDGFDDERSADFTALRYQIKHGGLRDLMTLPDLMAQCPPSFDPDALLLIREPNVAQSEVGRSAQQLSAAFVDGYLAAHAELTRYLMQMYREKQPNAALTHRRLSPLLDRQNSTYDELCKALNCPELYDENNTKR